MKRKALITSALIAPALLVLGGCDRQPSETAETKPAPQSTEWTEEDPTKPAVPVTLPDTPMRNVPASGEANPALSPPVK